MRPTVFNAAIDPSTQTKTKWVSNKWRLVCLAVTVAALFLVFRRIPVRTLWVTLRGMRVEWFLGSIVLYGLMFLPAARRWHLALRVNDSIVDAAATVRFSIIGHFFYLLLFGGAGGDTAKAAVYARRYKLPLPKTLASVSLDRLMGSGALIVVAAIAFGIAAAHGGFGGTKSFSLRGSAWWLLLLLPAIIVALIFLRRSRHESILHRFAAAFLEGGKRLLSSPKMVLSGFTCSLLMQVAVNGALAMNLQAVSHAPIPWLRLVWTFPLITAVSGLPITFAGIGARDGAAIALLGWCGVAAADAEAMSLLTLCVSVFWGLVGGFVLWREANTPVK
jgi:glycosyltransferase 2 family protein